jgi:hypothetical protein
VTEWWEDAANRFLSSLIVSGSTPLTFDAALVVSP